MDLSVYEQAYALAVLGGPPVFNVTGWSERVSALAKAAGLDWLLDEDAVRRVAVTSREIAAGANTPDAVCEYLLLAEWLESCAANVTIWSNLSKCLYLKTEELHAVYKQTLIELSELDLIVPPVTHFGVVEEFPAPFGLSNFDAFCPDPEDEKRFGIPSCRFSG